jgi:hypothetical protein
MVSTCKRDHSASASSLSSLLLTNCRTSLNGTLVKRMKISKLTTLSRDWGLTQNCSSSWSQQKVTPYHSKPPQLYVSRAMPWLIFCIRYWVLLLENWNPSLRIWATYSGSSLLTFHRHKIGFTFSPFIIIQWCNGLVLFDRFVAHISTSNCTTVTHLCTPQYLLHIFLLSLFDLAWYKL